MGEKKVKIMKKRIFLKVMTFGFFTLLLASACSPKTGMTFASGYADDMVDEVAADWDYALLHIYRPAGAGALVGYDVLLGDEVICRSKNKWKTTLEIRDFGQNMLWASTESKVELPVNFEKGREYYVRCGIKMGIVVGRPTLELVSKKTGKPQFDAIKVKD